MSNESEDEDIQCFLDVELETLRSIYVNELEVLCDEGRPTSVAIQLHPSTADNVDEQYVRMSLILNLPIEYPDVIPDIRIKNPRGLSDEKLERIADDLFSKAEERKGGTMLFELIERAKDHLTAGNRPSCQCAICLYGFTEQDVFTKTKCYHYFHSHCLSRYVAHQLKEVEVDKPVEHSKVQEASKEVFCPVCRIPISFPVLDECSFPPPTSAKEDNFAVTEELKQLQNKMADLYEKQKDKGGIIDVEAEKKKFLLEISSVPSKIESVPAEDEHPSTVRKNTSEEVTQDFSERKGDNDLSFPKNSDTTNSARNSNSRNRESSNRYQKYNRKGKDPNYAPGRNSEARNNKSYNTKKRFTGSDKESSKQYSSEDPQERKYGSGKSTHASDPTDDLDKDSIQKDDDRNAEILQATLDTCDAEQSSPVDPISPSMNEKCSEGNMAESIQNKHHYSDRTGSRPGYHKRYPNYNRRNDLHNKQRQYTDDGGRKYPFNEPHRLPFGAHASSRRRNENYHQHFRQSDNYHQQRNAGNYNQRYRNAENYNQHSGRRGNYRENQDEDFNCPPRQNESYRQSRQDFHRKPRYHSNYEQYKPNEREQLAPHYDFEKTSYGDSKDHCIRKNSHVQNTSSYREDKSVEKQEQNVIDDFDNISKDESFQNRSKVHHEHADRKSYSSPRKTNKPQHESHRYPNKYDDRPRNRTNSYEDNQCSPSVLPENTVLKNSDHSLSHKVSTSPDRYPNHPFKKSNGKMSSEAHRTKFPQNRRQISVVKANKINDVSPPNLDISSDCNHEIFSHASDSYSANSPKGSNNPVVRNTDVNHSVSRPPPPGFAKKVVYGLPSVKPPPGFSQS